MEAFGLFKSMHEVDTAAYVAPVVSFVVFPGWGSYPRYIEEIINHFSLSQIGCFVADFSPLRHHRGNLQKLETAIKKLDGPCLYQVGPQT